MDNSCIKRLLLLTTLSLTACGGGGDGTPKKQPSNTPPEGLVINMPPVATAGKNQNILDSAQVTLDGAGNDSDGTIEAFLWQQITGETVTLSTTNTSFTVLESAGTNQARYRDLK